MFLDFLGVFYVFLYVFVCFRVFWCFSVYLGVFGWFGGVFRCVSTSIPHKFPHTLPPSHLDQFEIQIFLDPSLFFRGEVPSRDTNGD